MPHRFHTVHDGRQTLEQGFAELIAVKQRAVQARQAPRLEPAESPREVYAAACADIGRALESDGYRYFHSGDKCSKRDGNFTYEVTMSSSVYNVSGEHVCLRIFGLVKSRRFKAWQTETGLPNPGDTAVSGQLGYLGPDHLELVWELADPGTRPAVVQGAIAAIREIAFPWFALFTDIPALCQRLLEGSVPMVDIVTAINLLMCFSGRDDAIAAGRGFLARRTDLVQPYQQELKLLGERAPLRIHGLGYAKELAIVSRFFDLGELA